MEDAFTSIGIGVGLVQLERDLLDKVANVVKAADLLYFASLAGRRTSS